MKINNYNSKHLLSYVIPICIVLFCLLGFILKTHNPLEANIMQKFLQPSSEYPFGTDHLGRCVFSRIMEGGRVTLGITLFCSTIVLLLGTILGMLFAHTKKHSTLISDSFLNALTAIPPIIYLIVLVGIWGNNILSMSVSLIISFLFRMIRLSMTLVEEEFQKAYVKCAIANGASKPRVMLIHIFPNIILNIVQTICLSCSEMIAAIAGFSFIGINLGSDVVDWGTMLRESLTYTTTAPTLIIWPIVFIFACSMSFNFIGNLLLKRRTLDVGN